MINGKYAYVLQTKWLRIYETLAFKFRQKMWTLQFSVLNKWFQKLQLSSNTKRDERTLQLKLSDNYSMSASFSSLAPFSLTLQ